MIPADRGWRDLVLALGIPAALVEHRPGQAQELAMRLAQRGIPLLRSLLEAARGELEHGEGCPAVGHDNAMALGPEGWNHHGCWCGMRPLLEALAACEGEWSLRAHPGDAPPPSGPLELRTVLGWASYRTAAGERVAHLVVDIVDGTGGVQRTTLCGGGSQHDHVRTATPAPDARACEQCVDTVGRMLGGGGARP
jgi:hypothetical protein